MGGTAALKKLRMDGWMELMLGEDKKMMTRRRSVCEEGGEGIGTYTKNRHNKGH